MAEKDTTENSKDEKSRQACLQNVTKKLVIFTAIILTVLAVYLYNLSQVPAEEKKPIIILFTFVCGLLGGFVSIQQRLPKIEKDELQVLSESWLSITLIPINGGIFALVLMLMFASSILQGELFPKYKTFSIDNVADIYRWVKEGYPETGADIAKLFFWSFVAGFSERFVPQVIRKTSDSSTGR
jgi:hypothetical protein